MKIFKKIGLPIISILGIIGFVYILSAVYNSEMIAPSPTKIFKEFIALFSLENFVKSHLSVPVLFETRDGEYMHGHAPNFVEIKAKSSENLSGKIEFVKPIYTDGKMIFGELL